MRREKTAGKRIALRPFFIQRSAEPLIHHRLQGPLLANGDTIDGQHPGLA